MISKDQKENIICTMDGVRGDVLGPPHGTTPAVVIANNLQTTLFTACWPEPRHSLYDILGYPVSNASCLGGKFFVNETLYINPQ